MEQPAVGIEPEPCAARRAYLAKQEGLSRARSVHAFRFAMIWLMVLARSFIMLLIVDTAFVL